MILRWGEAEILGNPEERTRDVRTGEEREEERRQLATISWTYVDMGRMESFSDLDTSISLGTGFYRRRRNRLQH